MAEYRREFALPPDDVAFLEEMGWPWESIHDGKSMWLLIHEYPVLNGYQIKTTSVALQLAETYPDAQIDMVYFFPALTLASGTDIRKLTDQSLDGNVWQRWSRHRTAKNPWRPGVDCLETHILLVGEWLARELRDAA